MEGTTAASPFHAQLRSLQKRSRNIAHRLRSIAEDADNAETVITDFAKAAGCTETGQLPVLANLRCGRWYTKGQEDGTCYFKSTDGHYGKWAVSRTRVNMHVVDVAAREGGVVIVDATQHGKRYPDALAKTVPLWAHCVNLAFFEGDSGPPLPSLADQVAPFVPPSEVSAMEAAAVAGVELLRSSGVRPAAELTKPLRCCFAARSARPGVSGIDSIPDEVSAGDQTPLLLLSASGDSSIPTARRGWAYVAGAGDDEESWATGLAPHDFFANRHFLTESGVDDGTIAERVAATVAAAKSAAELPTATSQETTPPVALELSVSLGRRPCGTPGVLVVFATHESKKGPVVTITESPTGARRDEQVSDKDVHVSFNAHTPKDLEVALAAVAPAVLRPSAAVFCVGPTPDLAATCATAVMAIRECHATQGAVDKAALQKFQRVASAPFGGIPARHHIKQINRFCLSNNGVDEAPRDAA
jgi:tRNA A64-2'-O-ribosylphosphate transferase